MTLRVQISDYDSYQFQSLNLDQLSGQVSRVPIVRIYGSISVPTEKSSTITSVSSSLTCTYNVIVHVHNYYPYLFVDCNEKIPNLPKLINYLEVVLKNSLGKRRRKKDTHKEDRDDDDYDDVEMDDIDVDDVVGKRKYIANVALCKATPMYGFNVGNKLVYKISLLSPLYKSTLIRLINEDTIVFGSNRRRRNIYEGHIPYLLQFLTDFNLFGCSWIDIGPCNLRFPIFNNQYKSDDVSLTPLKVFLENIIKPGNILDPGVFERTGHSMLEIDIRTELILNRKNIKTRNIHSKLGRVKFQAIEKYLSSLNLLSKDIAFQSSTRGVEFVFRSQLHRSEETGGGGTKWTNQQELDQLLEYVIEISGTGGSIQSRNYEEFTSEHYKDEYHNIPTPMELLDNETEILNYDGGLLLMSFGRDLLKWLKLDDLWWGEPVSYVIVGDQEKSKNVIDLIPELIPELVPELIPELVYNNMVTPSVPISPDIKNTDLVVNAITGFGSDDSFSFSDDELPNLSISFSQVDRSILTQRKRSHYEAFQPNSASIQVNSPTVAFVSFPSHSTNSFQAIPPISILKSNILATFDQLGLPKVDYLDPHYDNIRDGLAPPLVFANKKIPVPCVVEDQAPCFKLENWQSSMSQEIRQQLELNLKDKHMQQEVFGNERQTQDKLNIASWCYVPMPPSKDCITNWLKVEEPKENIKKKQFVSQLERFTASNNFKYSYRSGERVLRKPDEFIDLTTLNMEIHCNTTSENFLPNPAQDPITLLVYSFLDPNQFEAHRQEVTEIFVLLDLSSSKVLDYETILLKIPLNREVSITSFYDEEEMIGKFVEKVRYYDPDILCGYEIISNSWGYVIERFKLVYEINLCFEFSRSKFKSNGKVGDRWGYTHTSNIKIPGRHMLNIWRLLRHEINLTNYSMENVAYHLIHETVPKFLHYQLTTWYKQGGKLVEPVLKYFLMRVRLSFKFIEVQEIILRNCEQSRLIGVDFYSNFYRGSQYKVESILVRLTKAENLLLNSPSKKQVHDMRSLECIPLVMEPDSNFYKSPLIVLDFQSLYPSIIIAYNYCYSTLLGKLKGFELKKNEVGYLKNLKLPPGLIEVLNKNDDIIVSPNGYMFVKSRVRKSLLAKMLEEVLEARINVKSLMKLFSDESIGQGDAALKKLYNSKQLALKLIANVTYGYTSATYSGRMPNSDIADAIVSTGRELLTQSIDLIEKNLKWGAKVVYGDTDSLFVYLPGKTKDDAFEIGREIAGHISSQFPNPITLKFEKVYHPCVLLSKKRYVGYSYEYEGQKILNLMPRGLKRFEEMEFQLNKLY